jgi:hypothetical protein
MPLDSWLQEVVKDENVLGNIRETLGLGSYSSESFGSSDSFDEYGSSEESASSSSSDDW